MIHVVCLTKTYNYSDLAVWFTYYDKLGYRIHLIDNDSSCSIDNLVKGTNHTYEKISGWPDQWNLFNKILNENRYGFEKGDLVAFIDDDEFLWYYLDYWKMVEQYEPRYKDKYYEPMEKYVEGLMGRQLFIGLGGCILIPQTLMSTHELMLVRPRNSYIETHLYRRNDKSTQGKAIVMYDPKFKYDFTVKTGKEIGHVPVISKEKDIEHQTRFSYVNGEGISQSTYGDTDYTACLRLYHYHIKSEEDWEKKINRGSAAVDRQWYDADVRKNLYFGDYNILDMTMFETMKLMDIV